MYVHTCVCVGEGGGGRCRGVPLCSRYIYTRVKIQKFHSFYFHQCIYKCFEHICVMNTSFVDVFSTIYGVYTALI